MRAHMFRIHHLFFMSEESVLECVFWKVFQCENTCFVSTTWFLWLERVCESVCFQRWFSPDSPASIFWKRDRAMREHVCRIHHLFFYESRECVSVYVLKRCSVQAVPHLIFEHVTVQCENTFFACTSYFVWARRVSEKGAPAELNVTVHYFMISESYDVSDHLSDAFLWETFVDDRVSEKFQNEKEPLD